MTSPIVRAFCSWVDRQPTKPALHFDVQSYTYERLAALVGRLSAGLFRAGFRPGDHVGVMLPNGAEFVLFMLAAADLGLVIVPQNLTMSPAGLANSFNAADVTHILGWHSVVEPFKNSDSGFRTSERTVWVTLGGTVSACLRMEDLLDGPDAALLQHDLGDQQPYILCLTSGSTGAPKPITLLQSTKVARAQAARQLYAVTDNDITLAATPLYHSLAERLVLLPLMTGGTSVVMAGFSAKDWLETVSRHRVSFSIAVSSQLKLILQELRAGRHQIDSLRCLVSSSALLDPGLKAELLEYLPCDFHECYGTSEIAIASNLDRASGRRKTASVGVAAPGVDIKILSDQLQPLPAGRPGEIACRTPMRFAGYYQRPDLTEAAMWGEYFRTGDLGRLDEEGFLYFLGRKKEIIITGGVNVYPQDVENALLTHPQVSECAVVPMPDARLGEVVCAVVVARDRSLLKVRELQRIAARQLADYQQPHHFVVLDELPKNRMGKLMKRDLLELLSQNNYFIEQKS